MPAIEDLHLGNQPLTNLSIAYQNANFVGELLYPTVIVKRESDKYATFNKDNFRLEETIKGAKSEANKVDYSVSSGSYQITYHVLEGLVTPRDVANAATPFQPFQDMTVHLTDQIKLRLEYDIATAVMASGSYNTGMKSTTGLPKFNGSSGDVIEAVVSGCYQVHNKIGKPANTVVMDTSTFIGLKTNTKILDRVKYTSAEAITEEILARLFEVDNVYVGLGIRNTAKEGQSDSLSGLWGEGIACLYVEPSPGLRRASWGYLFRQNGGRIVETRPADNIETGAKYVRVVDNYDDKIVDANAGYILLNTVQ